LTEEESQGANQIFEELNTREKDKYEAIVAKLHKNMIHCTNRTLVAALKKEKGSLGDHPRRRELQLPSP
jgi:hypothetical protein